MKITAEFNSNEELMNFISTFSSKAFTPSQGTAIPITPVKDIKPAAEIRKAENPKIEDKKETPSNDVPWEDKKEDTKNNEDPKSGEDPKVTKEMVRAIFSKIIKAGKQKEAKVLTAKYGASKIPEIKDRDYATIYKEAEGLL